MRIIVSFLVLFIWANVDVFAQQNSEPEKVDSSVVEEPVYEIVEKQPEFPGGMMEMFKFISTNLVYPEVAIKNSLEGNIIIEFIVEKDGSITNIKIIKDIGGGCGEAGVDVFKLMPIWTPGTQRDQPVRVKMKAPIKFRLSKK
jgi:TonB family protein